MTSRETAVNDDPDYVRSVAMAINGPFSEMPARSRYSLNEIRAVKWSMLTRQEQNGLLRTARAVIAQTKVVDRNEIGEYPAVGLRDT